MILNVLGDILTYQIFTHSTRVQLVNSPFYYFKDGAPRLSLTKYFCDCFLQVSLTIFLRWSYLNNLCRESIAQDCMQVLQIFCDVYILIT